MNLGLRDVAALTEAGFMGMTIPKAYGGPGLTHLDALLVVGAPNSSNSKRLVEVGQAEGCDYALLVQTAQDIDWRAIEGVTSVGLTAGASAPEILVNGVVDAFRERFDVTIERIVTAEENVSFKMPRVLREGR